MKKAWKWSKNNMRLVALIIREQRKFGPQKIRVVPNSVQPTSGPAQFIDLYKSFASLIHCRSFNSNIGKKWAQPCRIPLPSHGAIRSKQKVLIGFGCHDLSFQYMFSLLLLLFWTLLKSQYRSGPKSSRNLEGPKQMFRFFKEYRQLQGFCILMRRLVSLLSGYCSSAPFIWFQQ